MLRKLLLTAAIVSFTAGGALAADLPTQKAPPVFTPPPPPAFTWTGLYIGAQAGYEWGRSSPNLYGGPAGGSLPSINAQGVDGGVHIGYNYQVSQFVFGVEGDVNGASYHGSNYGALLSPYSTREPVDGSLRGRAGIAFDRILVYGTGGVAFGDFQNDYAGPFGFDSESTGRVGWTVGGGIEYALTDNWSIRAEYRYTDFGHVNNYLTASLPGYSVSSRETDSRAQVGVSYKFDMFAPPGGIVSKY